MASFALGHPVAHGLDVAADVAQGRPQLVGDVGHEAAALLLRLLQVRRHPVEGVAQASDLVLRGGVDALGEVAAAQPLRRRGKSAHRRQRAAGDEADGENAGAARGQAGPEQCLAHAGGEVGVERLQALAFEECASRHEVDAANVGPIAGEKRGISDCVLQSRRPQAAVRVGDEPAVGVAYDDARPKQFRQPFDGGLRAFPAFSVGKVLDEGGACAFSLDFRPQGLAVLCLPPGLGAHVPADGEERGGEDDGETRDKPELEAGDEATHRRTGSLRRRPCGCTGCRAASCRAYGASCRSGNRRRGRNPQSRSRRRRQ